MKSFKQHHVLNEASMDKLAKDREFKDSLTATEYFENIQTYLGSPALMDWANSTNRDTAQKLKVAIKAYDTFVDALYAADE